jgi:hypothetical protein
MADENKAPAVTDRAGLTRIFNAVRRVERTPVNEVPKARGRVSESGISTWGDWTLTYSEALTAAEGGPRWIGCKTVTLEATTGAPPAPSCPAATVAYTYIFGFNALGQPFLRMEYVFTPGNLCMPDSGCGAARNGSASTAGPVAGWTCDPLHIQFSQAFSNAYRKPSGAGELSGSTLIIEDPE